MIEKYVVLGDVVNSRNIDNRDLFEDALHRALSHVNREYDRSIHADFELIKGIDEFGGVLNDLRCIYKLISRFYDETYPAEIRFAIFRGNIDVNENGTVSEMDGSAFHYADELLHEVEADGQLVYMRAFGPVLDSLIDGNINLLLTLRSTWTTHQFEVIRAYERLGTQQAVANDFDIKQQTVSDVLRSANYPRFAQVRDELNEVLSIIYDDSLEYTI